jgi:choline-sulfatase
VDQKHIIFLLSDQHNGNVVGYGGDPTVRTPNLNTMAKNGTVLSNCYCSSPLCVPSRSSMLSGLLPSETGIFNNFQCLGSDKMTFAHSLAAAD